MRVIVFEVCPVMTDQVHGGPSIDRSSWDSTTRRNHMRDPETQNGLLTPDELAEDLRVSTRTIRRLQALGVIPSIKVTRNLPRYDLAEVLIALKSRMETSETDK